MDYLISHISNFNLEEINLIEKSLSKSERQRLSSKPRDKYVQSLAARALLKRLLESKDYDTSGFLVERDLSGKPMLISPSGLYISLAHSDNMVGCALSERPVGIDLQKIGCVSDKTVQRVCTQSEKEYIKLAHPSAFYSIWTMKEAYLKSTGCSFAQMIKTSFVKDGKILKQDNILKLEYGINDGYAWAVIEL